MSFLDLLSNRPSASSAASSALIPTPTAFFHSREKEKYCLLSIGQSVDWALFFDFSPLLCHHSLQVLLQISCFLSCAHWTYIHFAILTSTSTHCHPALLHPFCCLPFWRGLGVIFVGVYRVHYLLRLSAFIMVAHNFSTWLGLLLLLPQRLLAQDFSLYPTVDPDLLASALNISAGCLDTLYAVFAIVEAAVNVLVHRNTTLPCDNFLFSWAVNADDYFWSEQNLTTLCTSDCATAVNTWEQNVALACVDDDLVTYGVLVPAFSVAGRYQDGYGAACLQSRYCTSQLMSSTWLTSVSVPATGRFFPITPSLYHLNISRHFATPKYHFAGKSQEY